MAPDDMARIDLDPQLAERLIEGRADAAHLPPGAAGAAAVVDAARRAATEGDDSRMAATVAAMRAVLVPEGEGAPAAAPRPARRTVPAPLPRIVAAGTAGLAVLFGGLAAAGALPAAAQKPVADLAAHVGIDLPKPASTDTSEKPAEPTTSTTATTSTTLPAGDTTETTAPTSDTTVTAPACPAPSYVGPNGCITPLPIPVAPTTSLPPPTTTTTAPPPPTTTTTTTVPDGGGPGGGAHGRFDG
jgi:hypothetical protein